MDENGPAPSITLESPIKKSLNPLDRHEIQGSFYHPCKLLGERFEKLKFSWENSFFFMEMLRAAVDSVDFLIKNREMRRIIHQMDQRSYVSVDARIFGSFCPVLCQSISDIKKKVSDLLLQSFPCIPAMEKDVLILCNKRTKRCQNLMSKLQSTFVSNFTDIGLGSIDFVTSWLCYAVLRFLEAVTQVLFLKEVENDKWVFKTRADAILEAMEVKFIEELLGTLQILEGRKLP